MSLSAAFSAEVRVGSSDSPRKPAVSAVMTASRAAMYSSTGLVATAAAAAKNIDIMVDATNAGFAARRQVVILKPHARSVNVTLRYFYSLSMILLLRTGTARAMKTIEAPPTMTMRVPSDLSSSQLLELLLQWADGRSQLGVQSSFNTSSSSS
jgi:hypothetical protein